MKRSFGFNLGERSRLAYWVNRIFYPEPTRASCKMADATQDASMAEPGTLATRAVGDPAQGIEPLLPVDATSTRERQVLEAIAQKALREDVPTGLAAADYHARVLPLPKPLREFITRRTTKAFLKDVHEFLFVKERRDVMRESVLSRLRTGGGPFVVIGHSQGSLVAYDVLSSLTAADGIEVDLFVTIGSPLGLKEVQDQLKVITNQKKGLAVPSVRQTLGQRRRSAGPGMCGQASGRRLLGDQRCERRRFRALECRFASRSALGHRLSAAVRSPRARCATPSIAICFSASHRSPSRAIWSARWKAACRKNATLY